QRQPSVSAVAEHVPASAIAHGLCRETSVAEPDLQAAVGEGAAVEGLVTAAEGEALSLVGKAHAYGIARFAFPEDEVVMRLGIEPPAVHLVPRRPGVARRRGCRACPRLLMEKLRQRRGCERLLWRRRRGWQQGFTVALDKSGVDLASLEGGVVGKAGKECRVGC